MRATATLFVIATATLLALGAPAWADEGQGPTLSHKGQFGVNAQVGSGFRVLFPYNEEYCGQAGKSVCTGAMPAFLDLGVSFGVTDAIDLQAELRLGLGTDFEGVSGQEGPRPLAYAFGARFFVDADGQLKFFSALEFTIDTTDYSGTAGVDPSADYGVRSTNAVLIDLQRNLGVYGFFGPAVSFKTWLRFDLLAGVGVQARFP